MNGPVRLLSSSSPAGVLLRAGRRDRPRDGVARERAAIAAVAAVSAVSVGWSASGVASWVLKQKVVYLLLPIALVIGGGGAILARRAMGSSSGAPGSTTPQVVVVVPPVLEPRPLVPTSFDIIEAPKPADARSSSHSPSPPPSSSPATSMIESPARESEIDLVRRARVELKNKDLRGARATLAEHRARFPKGILAEEAGALRVEVLAQSGDEAGAKAAASSFMKAYPESAYVERVRSVLARMSAIPAP